jgi:dipeptidyl aminopeptidase/acylaminoacyl peptidase
MIVEMNDITAVSRSPDGNAVVIGLAQDHPQTNQRELSWVIVQVRGGGTPIKIAAGEEIFDPVGLGARLNPAPQWSPDGKWFFYLRRGGREVQLWKTSREGRNTQQVTHSNSDVVGLSGTTSPNELAVQLAPDRELLQRAEEEENHQGVLYDDHVIGDFPVTETMPSIDRWRNLRRNDSGEFVPIGWTGTSSAIFDIRRNELKSGQEPAPGACHANCSEGPNFTATAVAVGEVPADSNYYPGQYTLQVQSKSDGHAVLKCSLSACTANQISVLGWSAAGTEVYFVADSLVGRLGGGLPGRSEIYAWNPAENRIRQILDSDGRFYVVRTMGRLTLAPAYVAGGDLVVAAAGADQPPKVEVINLSSGASRVIFDPNVELRAQTSGRAVWHSWPTSTSFPGRGMVVLPRSYVPGKRYPVVITLYACGNAFLQGGSSEGLPEFVASEAGFVAICIDFPVRQVIASRPGPGQMYPILCDIITSLIKNEDEAGLIDRTRVGLTGHSLGANVAAYCLSHTNAIAAAALRHGSVMERNVAELFDTAAWNRDPVNSFDAHVQMPDPRHDPQDFWGQMSSANKAPGINTRVLMQISEAEHLTALPLWSALHENNKAVEMYVFPKETHQLIMPIHELVNDERQLDWFKYWLKDEKDEAPAKREQYKRWDALRAQSRQGGTK